MEGNFLGHIDSSVNGYDLSHVGVVDSNCALFVSDLKRLARGEETVQS